MAAGSIVVDLLMKTGAFETDTKRAERRLRELQKEAERAGKVIAAAFVAAAAATGALIKSAIDTADAMSKLAQQTGVSTEALSSLSFAAKLSNVSNEELSRALRRLSADAANGGDKLRALGISLKDAGGASKTADQLFADVAERISKLPDGIQKTNALIELFGDRVGPKLAPLLNQGKAGIEAFKKEAASLGLVISDDFGKAAEEFNDNLTRLKGLVSGLGIQLASNLVPRINGLVVALVAAIKESDSLFVSLTALAGINPFGTVKSNLNAARVELAKLLEQAETGGQKNRFTGGIGAAILNRLNIGADQNLTPRINQLRAQIAALEAIEAEATKPPKRTGALDPQGRVETQSPRVKAEMSFAELLQKNAEIRAKLAQEAEDAATKLYEQQIQQEAELQAARQLAAQARIDADENAANAFIERQKAEAEAIKDKLNPLREYERALERIAVLQEADLLTEGEAVAAVNQLSEAFVKLGKDTKDASDVARSLGLTFSSAFEDAIAGGKGFTDILKSIERDLLRLGTRKLITEPLLGAFEGAFSGGVGAGASGLLSGAGSFLRGLIPGFETGTDFVPRTGLALVHQGERIIPAAENRAGMGAPSIVFNISTPDANSFRQSSSQIAAKMAMAVAAGRRNM